MGKPAAHLLHLQAHRCTSPPTCEISSCPGCSSAVSRCTASAAKSQAGAAVSRCCGVRGQLQVGMRGRLLRIVLRRCCCKFGNQAVGRLAGSVANMPLKLQA